MIDPVIGRRERRIVPVIDRPEKNEQRFLARPVMQPAVWIIGNRRPPFELWIRLERIVVVVVENDLRCATGDEQAIVAGGLQCLVRKAFHPFQVGRVMRRQLSHPVVSAKESSV